MLVLNPRIAINRVSCESKYGIPKSFKCNALETGKSLVNRYKKRCFSYDPLSPLALSMCHAYVDQLS